MPDKEPTRAQLTAKIARLEAKLVKYERGDPLRKKGEHWYRLVEWFDVNEIQRLPTAGSTYIMGVLNDVAIVEVPAAATVAEIAEFTKLLEARGLTAPCLVVRAGVRFLKLAAVDAGTEAKLDSAEVKSEASKGDTVSDASAGPEPERDGLGGSGSGDGADHRSGGDRDEAADGAREEAPARR